MTRRLNHKIGHLCGRSFCPGDKAHDHPYFSSFGKSEPSESHPHPSLIREAGKNPYDTWTGDNTVFVVFRDGKKAIFPGDWLRQQAEQGEKAMTALFKRHRTGFTKKYGPGLFIEDVS